MTLHYLTIIRSEINNHHNDKSESIAAMVSFSMVYAEMWAEAYSLVNDLTELSKHSFLVGYNGETRVKLLDPEAITSLSNGEKSKGIPKDYKPTYKYAKTLSKTYHKALFELKGSIKTTETEVIKHHASIVGDTLDAMLELVQGIHPDNEPTEIFLPKTHPQWLDKSTWMESREEG
ncbi:MAG: hypothetical protein HEP71_03370 [Roseivirga sp.]|nr:hypothetical protein [Roseivirga sp.]